MVVYLTQSMDGFGCYQMTNSRTVAKEGGGGEPPFKWNVERLDQMEKEAQKQLDGAQYEHMKDQVRSLAREDDPTHPQAVDVRALGNELYELRDKGGPLRKLNVRIFFNVLKKAIREIVLLGLIKKENEGKTSPAKRKLMMLRGKKYIVSRKERLKPKGSS